MKIWLSGKINQLKRCFASTVEAGLVDNSFIVCQLSNLSTCQDFFSHGS